MGKGDNCGRPVPAGPPLPLGAQARSRGEEGTPRPVGAALVPDSLWLRGTASCDPNPLEAWGLGGRASSGRGSGRAAPTPPPGSQRPRAGLPEVRAGQRLSRAPGPDRVPLSTRPCKKRGRNGVELRRVAAGQGVSCLRAWAELKAGVTGHPSVCVHGPLVLCHQLT